MSWHAGDNETDLNFRISPTIQLATPTLAAGQVDASARGESLWSSLATAAVLFGCLGLVYLQGSCVSSTITIRSTTSAYTNHGNCRAHPQAAYLVFVGRPLFMPINCGVAGLMNTVSDAHTIRLIGLAILSASGAAIVGVLRAYGVRRLVAGAAVVALMSVLGWQVVLSMSQAAAVVWSLPPTLGAFFLVRRIVDSESLFGARAGWSFVGAVTLVVLASLTYQQNTAILFSLCAISVVLSPLSRGRRVFLWAVAVYAVSGPLLLPRHSSPGRFASGLT